MGVALRFCLAFCLLIACVLGQPSYDPKYGWDSQVNYNVNRDAKRFPVEDNVTESTYNYFISKLNFDAISGKIVTGAADKLYLLDFNLKEEDTLIWTTDPSLYSQGFSSPCTSPQNAISDIYTCRNHIRVFESLPEDDQKLFVCGTQSTWQPQCRIVDISGGTFSPADPSPASDGIISLHPDLPDFGEFRNSNENDTTFFAASFQRTDAREHSISYQNVTVTNTSNLDTLEMTERFRTIRSDDNWLRFPVTFVDYYRADYPVKSPATQPEDYQFYFVFLRENLIGGNSGDLIYSRIVRICRNDMGSMATAGPNVGSRYFTTYLKARIFCEREVPCQSNAEFVGALDYQFNIMRSMVFNEGGRTTEDGNWNRLMYGAFTGPVIGPMGSAICVYNAENTFNSSNPDEGGFSRGIFDIFRGDIQVNDQVGMTTEEQNTFVECDPEGRTDNIAAKEVLIVGNVQQLGEDPILAVDGYYISQMVVDRVCVVRSQNVGECVNQDVLFLGTSTGRIMKVVFATEGTRTTPVVSEDIALDDGNIVNNLQIQVMNRKKYLFANTWSRIYRLPLDRCSRFGSSCSRCIESRDPYCVWNTTSNMCELHRIDVAEGGVGAVPPNIRQDIHSGNSTLLCIRYKHPQRAVVVPISIVDDNIYEGNESFTIAPSSTGDVMFTQENTTVTIIDNDDPIATEVPETTTPTPVIATCSPTPPPETCPICPPIITCPPVVECPLVTCATLPASTPTLVPPPGVLFQIGLSGPMCSNWINSSVETKTERVVDVIVSEVNTQCQCGLTQQQFRNTGFRCGTNNDMIVFRGELLSTPQSSASKLRAYIENWATFAPGFPVGNEFLQVDSTCPVAIESLRDPACGGHQPTTAVVMSVSDVGPATAGWVIAALAIVAVIILSIAVVLVGFLYLRARKQVYKVTPGADVPLMKLENNRSNESTLISGNTKDTVNSGGCGGGGGEKTDMV